jgi:ketosteroid isomerase-like protein
MHCDICEIKNLVYKYADHIDRGELEALAAMFEQAVLVAVDADGIEAEIRGEQAILDMYRHFTRLYEDDGTPHTLHLTSNVIVEVEDNGVAAGGRSYAIVFQARDGFPLQPIIGVRYEDVFLQESGDWRFSRRRIETRLLGDLSHHLLQPM